MWGDCIQQLSPNGTVRRRTIWHCIHKEEWIHFLLAVFSSLDLVIGTDSFPSIFTHPSGFLVTILCTRITYPHGSESSWTADSYSAGHKSSAFAEYKVSSACLQLPSSGSCSELVESSPHPPPISLRIFCYHFLRSTLKWGCCDSSVYVVTELRAAGPGFDFWRQGSFSSLRQDRLWDPSNLLSNGYRGALSPGIRLPEREADPSPPSSAEVRNAGNYSSTPPFVFLAWCLAKQRMSSWHGAQTTLPLPRPSHRAYWCSGNAPDLYSGGFRFEFRPVYQLSWLEVFSLSPDEYPDNTLKYFQIVTYPPLMIVFTLDLYQIT
jgi:hypothetical protein